MKSFSNCLWTEEKGKVLFGVPVTYRVCYAYIEPHVSQYATNKHTIYTYIQIKFLDGSSKVPCCLFFFDFKLCHVASSFQNSAEAFGAHCGGD